MSRVSHSHIRYPELTRTEAELQLFGPGELWAQQGRATTRRKAQGTARSATTIALMHECRHRLTRPETPVAHEQRGNQAILRPDKQPSPLGPPPNNDTKVCQKQYLTRPKTTCSHTAAPRKSFVLAFESYQISA